MNKSKTINFKVPLLKWLTNKNEKKFSKPTLKTTTVLINGKLFTCIVLSIVSGLIDLVFFSGLSKSFYELFGLIAIPAGLLMSVMSIGFTMGKFFCAMQLGAISELKTRLKAFGCAWYKNLNKLSWKWHIIHKFLIGVSILTSISLSVVSIGTGVTRNSTKLKQLDDLIAEGTKYVEVVNTAKDQSLAASVAKSVDTSEQDAIKFTEEQMDKIWPAIEQYKVDREAFNATGLSVSSTEPNETYAPNPSTYWDRRNESVNNLLQNAGYPSQTGQGIYNLVRSNVERTIQNRYLETHKPRNADEVKKELTAASESTLEEARGWLDTLNALDFTRNEQSIGSNGKIVYTSVPVVFDNDPNIDTKVLVTRALSLLRQYRTDVESDSGDIGASSKLFMMIGNAWDKIHATKSDSVVDALNVKVKTGMGSTEIMIMIVIMLFGIVQEFLIALFTPKSTISRKMLYQFDQYFDMANFDVNRFMLTTYLDYYNKGVISKDDFEAKARKCVELMQNTEDSIIERFSKKNIKEISENQYKNQIQDLKNQLGVIELNNKSKDKIIENLNNKIVILSKEKAKEEQPKLQKIQSDVIYSSKNDEDNKITEVESVNNTTNTASMDPGTIEAVNTIKKAEDTDNIKSNNQEDKLLKLKESLDSFNNDLENN